MFQPNEKIRSLSANELEKYFSTLFDKLSIRHGHHYVFDHFLDCTINGFCFNYSNDIMDQIRKKYSQDERYIFGEMVQIWILLADKKIAGDNDFYDFFGGFYEQQSISKQKGFAQYFTPETICKLMAQITIDKDGENVYEPACGSGRLNLAIHSINHKCFHYANDLDFTCAKMATLNFMLHGIKGVVTCDDGLWPKSKFKGAFLINVDFAPSISFLDNSEFAYNLINSKLSKPSKAGTKVDFADMESVVCASYQEIVKEGQLTLF